MDNPLTIVSQAQQYQAQNNESTYGPIADSYAQKYGIPLDVFRNVIRSASGFDPNYSSGDGSGGIGNLDVKSIKDPQSNVSGSLDYVGNLMSSLYKSTGSWTATEKMMSPDAGQQSTDSGPDNSWAGKVGGFFKSAGYTILISAVGALLILGSVWVILNSSQNK